jgi:hypothetical protein
MSKKPILAAKSSVRFLPKTLYPKIAVIRFLLILKYVTSIS